MAVKLMSRDKIHEKKWAEKEDCRSRYFTIIYRLLEQKTSEYLTSVLINQALVSFSFDEFYKDLGLHFFSLPTSLDKITAAGDRKQP